MNTYVLTSVHINLHKAVTTIHSTIFGLTSAHNGLQYFGQTSGRCSLSTAPQYYHQPIFIHTKETLRVLRLGRKILSAETSRKLVSAGFFLRRYFHVPRGPVHTTLNLSSFRRTLTLAVLSNRASVVQRQSVGLGAERSWFRNSRVPSGFFFT